MSSNDRRIEAERIRREQEAAAAQRRRVEDEDRARRQRDAAERDRRNQEEYDRQRRQRENQQAQDRQKKRQAETGCFVGSTPVLTPQGWKSLSELKKGDQVVSYDSSTGKTAFRNIRTYKKHDSAIIWEIHLEGVKDPIATTKTHSFLTTRGWQRTDRLRKGDSITTTGEHKAIVASVVKTERVEPVFNLVTDVDHTFVVAGCVVHNFTYFRTLRVWWHKAVALTHGPNRWRYSGDSMNPRVTTFSVAAGSPVGGNRL
jgi:hypothetical protein